MHKLYTTHKMSIVEQVVVTFNIMSQGESISDFVSTAFQCNASCSHIQYNVTRRIYFNFCFYCIPMLIAHENEYLTNNELKCLLCLN
jgi:hypothetical protein